MDVLEKKDKNEYDGDLRNIIFKLKFKNNPIEIKGSSSLKSQRFYSDIDLISIIDNSLTDEEAYDEIKKILDRMDSLSSVYFIELKIQNKDDKKFKYNKDNIDELSKEKFIKEFKKRNFIKLDYITFINNKFMELSIIYQFFDKKLTTEEYEKNIKDDINELIKEGNFYKVLKRMFNLYRVEGDLKKLIYLSRIFNSELGEIYQKISNLEAIEKILEFYRDKLDIKRVKLNLKEMGEPSSIKAIKKNREKYFKELNKKAKEIYKDLIK